MRRVALHLMLMHYQSHGTALERGEMHHRLSASISELLHRLPALYNYQDPVHPPKPSLSNWLEKTHVAQKLCLIIY